MNARWQLGIVAHLFDEEIPGYADVGHEGFELFLCGGDLFSVTGFRAAIVHLLRILLQVVKLHRFGVGEADQFVAVGSDAPMLG